MAIKKRKSTGSPVKTMGKKPDWQRTAVPKELFNAFKAIKDKKWQDDKLYQEYRALVKKYLGKVAEDRIEQGRLVVCLTRMALGSMNLDYTER